ncbi:MAG: hypothetical protein ACT4P6_19720 [Gemmatimonadaceae bacterium]
MRWSYCSACLTAVLAVACVKTTLREYFPSPENPRYTPERGSAAVRDYLRLRCSELAKPPARDSATLTARVRVDSGGKATAAQLSGSSGDAVMDGVIGTVVAQLDLSASMPRRGEYQARIAYSCRDSVAARIDVTP